MFAEIAFRRMVNSWARSAKVPKEGEYKDDEGNIRCCRCKEMRRELVPQMSISKSKELFAKVKETP